MNDSIVLERAWDDRKATEARIEELRSQIADHEEHMAEVAHFMTLFAQYAGGEATSPAAASLVYANE